MPQNLTEEQTNKRVVTLRFSILSIFVSIFVLTTILLVGVTSLRFEKTLSITSFRLMSQVATDIQSQIDTVMGSLESECQFIAELMKEGLLKPDSPQMIRYFQMTTAKLSLIQRTFLGDPEGNFIGTSQKSANVIETEIINRRVQPATQIDIDTDLQGNILQKKIVQNITLDPRVRPWYIDAEKARGMIWTDFYISKLDSTISIAVVKPLYAEQGKLLGVLGVEASQETLQQFIDQQKISEHGLLFITNKKGDVVAFSNMNKFVNSTGNKLLNLNDLGMPWLMESLQEYVKTGKKAFKLDYNGRTYFFTYKPVLDLVDYGWLIGVMVPRDDYTYYLERMHFVTILICLFTFILGIFLISKLVNKIIKPIKLLVNETNKIKNFELEGGIPIESRIKEVIILVNAMSAMKTGLRAFQKYIPKALVRKLIETQEDMRTGGVKVPIAVLFSDIKNFTAISETIDPNLLMTQLCDYFEELSKIIIQTGGTIDKYIGDSIMAFWGAPVPEENAAIYAARAALLCQQRLKELNPLWVSTQRMPFVTRFGIHVGEAIVGNVGSSERLNYTAIGDNINIASRLEEINKTYKTNIMISETMYEVIKTQFAIRMIDCVAVKGKLKSGYIYELLAESVKQVDFDLAAYNMSFAKGFAAYQQRRWDEALHYFVDECLTIYPKDTIAPIFIERCQHFKITPPPVNWDGVWRMEGI